MNKCDIKSVKTIRTDKTLQDRIRKEAYKIWLQEGKPNNCEIKHWVMAEDKINNLLEQYTHSKKIRIII
jgi:hypothetical protein